MKYNAQHRKITLDVTKYAEDITKEQQMRPGQKG